MTHKVSLMLTMDESDAAELSRILHENPDTMLRMTCQSKGFGAFVEVRHLGSLPEPIPGDVSL